ncbi:MAG: VIT domain-containing protein [Planctomycetota bacterium]|jgi:tetratricopeptide (TPR) repeat protein
MPRIVAWLSVLAVASVAGAQTVPPALMVRVDGKPQPLGLSRVEIDVRIFCYVAETTTTMTFYNPMDRVMEGDLYFPLPEGATVSGYALDVEGRMVDGVIVEKHKGREVFEKIVRQGIDPGLIEWTRGNNFKTRVFPIPARGTRTIRVEYAAELVGGPEEAAYSLPLNFEEKLRELSIRVEVLKAAAVPRIEKGGPAGFAFGRWRDAYVAETKLDDVALAEDLMIALPQVERRSVCVEEADDGEVTFVIHDFPQVSQADQAPAAPKHVVVYWDASGSRAAGDHQREIGLIEAYFRHLAATAPGRGPTVTVDLILLRNEQGEPRRLVLREADPSPLVALLEDVRYDGGTQLGAISRKPGSRTPDFYMLFTDGVSNFGLDEPRRLTAPMYAFSADTVADHAFLRHLAMSTGGQYFNLKRTADDAVVPSIGRPAYCFLSARADGGKVTGIHPKAPQAVGGRLSLVGKLTGQQANVTLSYGYPGEVPVAERTFAVSRGDAAKGSLLRRLWAQTKLADLVVLQERNEEEIVALGEQYGLVTPFTSLIVLDSLEQYVEHEIAPPESLPEMRAEYMRRIDTLEHQNRKRKADKLAAVVNMWRDRVAWWNTEFKYPKDFKYKAPKEERDDGRRPRSGAASPGAPPPAPGAPGRQAAPPPAEGADMEETAPAEGAETPAAIPLGEPGASEDAGPEADRSRQPGIVIKPWDPKTPYMKELKAAAKEKAFAVYLKNRAEFGTSPAFFLDCADYFFDRHQSQVALQVLSNIAELELENAALLRVLGHRLAQKGFLDLAVLTFEQVLGLRPEEPQSYRDLALVLVRRAEKRGASAKGRRLGPELARRVRDSIRDDYARAIELLGEVVLRDWDDRFAEIEVVALMELNGALPKAKAAGVEKTPLDERLRKLLDVDVRIVMNWDADNTDMDLWVIEPSGEKAFYGHNRTTIGGLVSRDFTGGYGPEEYLVRKAQTGTYQIMVNYYGSQATRIQGAVTVEVDVFTHFGRPSQARKSLTLRLKEAEETVTVGQIEF